jgi:tetratricopeptide (TPR) repeat protein
LRFAAALDGPRNTPQASQARVLLGQSLMREGQVAAGLHELERAYADSRALLGSDHPQTELMANFLGKGRLEAGDVHGAIVVFQAFFDSATQHHADRSPMALAFAHYSLANALAAAGERERALPLFDEAARLFAEAGGATAPLALRARSARALTLVLLGRLDEAERAFAALAAMPLAGEDKAVHDGHLAVLRSLQGKHDEAVPLARSSAEALKSNPSRSTQAQSLTTLGSVLLAAGRAAEAIPPLERAVSGSAAAGISRLRRGKRVARPCPGHAPRGGRPLNADWRALARM